MNSGIVFFFVISRPDTRASECNTCEAWPVIIVIFNYRTGALGKKGVHFHYSLSPYKYYNNYEVRCSQTSPPRLRSSLKEK